MNAATDHRPLLLLDVDGPLNPYAEKGHKRDHLPLPYKTLRLRPAGFERAKQPLRVWLAEQHGPMLCRFAVEHDVRLVWATTWMHDANTMIGPEIGLPPLPVIDFDAHPATLAGWKYPAILDYAAGRPLAWLDDDFRAASHLRAQDAFLRDRGEAPTLLHHVDPRKGIVADDLEAVGTWLDALAQDAPAAPADPGRERIAAAQVIARYDWEHGISANAEPGAHTYGEVDALIAAGLIDRSAIKDGGNGR